MDRLMPFIRNNAPGIFIACFLLTFTFAPPKIYDYLGPLWLILLLASTKRKHYKPIDFFSKKGLTKEDIANIRFTKSWYETRQNGMWRYMLIDGALIAGAVLSLFIGALYFIISPNQPEEELSELSDMFSLIGYSYLIGAIIALFAFRFKWIINEKRFKHLTDPLSYLN